jgi:hypothetical protein
VNPPPNETRAQRVHRWLYPTKGIDGEEQPTAIALVLLVVLGVVSGAILAVAHGVMFVVDHIWPRRRPPPPTNPHGGT